MAVVYGIGRNGWVSRYGVAKVSVGTFNDKNKDRVAGGERMPVMSGYIRQLERLDSRRQGSPILQVARNTLCPAFSSNRSVDPYGARENKNSQQRVWRLAAHRKPFSQLPSRQPLSQMEKRRCQTICLTSRSKKSPTYFLSSFYSSLILLQASKYTV